MSNDTHSCGLDTAAICAACTKTPVDGNQLGAVPDLGTLVDWAWSLRAEHSQLQAFAVEMINASFEGGSFDGGGIQDIAVKHGLLQIERREEECGERCACREYGFPAECYRKTAILGAAPNEVATQSTDNENVSRHEER